MDDSARHDAFTFGLAMEYLKSVQPRVLFISFDETDDWAHARRYDRVISSIGTARCGNYGRGCKARLRSDSTTLIVPCDHGRGATLDDCHGHGEDAKGSVQIWIAVVGRTHRAKARRSTQIRITSGISRRLRSNCWVLGREVIPARWGR